MNFRKNLAVWVVIAVLLYMLFSLFQGAQTRGPYQQVGYSDFLTEIESGSIRNVTIQGNKISGHYDDGRSFRSYSPSDPNLISTLTRKGVHITAVPPEDEVPSLFGILISWFPMLLLIGIWIFFMRQMQSGGGKAMGFGKSRARMLTEKSGRVTFEDVAGIDEAKQELEEIVDFLKDPAKFQRLGGKIPKGCLLVGPPGTGKTLLARAIAGEANVPFFTISGSDFVEMFVGVGASRVRDMFEQGKKNAPCIIFIDELDAVGRHRGAGLGGGNDEREQTLNQLLVEMDGFESNEGVILIAATNRPDVLDPALLRPGRFDRQVVVPNPDIVGREKIIKVHMRKVPLAPDVDAKVIARGTPGFSGADLANLVNEAALLAARGGNRMVTMHEFEAAKDKVMMGAERRSMVMSADEKKLTAYHEAGHAIVGICVPKHDPLHKVTIIPRGRALGVTMSLPERDRYSYSKLELESKLAVMFGGRIAEELIFGAENVTTGAGNDIQQATQMARRMITEYGFSDRLGPLRYTDNEEEIFLGHSVARQQTVSDATARLIDEEVRRFIEEAAEKARRILTEKHDDLVMIAEALLEYETLSGEEVRSLLKGEPIFRPDIDDDKPAEGTPGRASVPSTGKKARPAPVADRTRAGAAARLLTVPIINTTGRFGGIPLNRPLVMGIVNVTPDSFSDGGETFSPDQAIARGLRLIAEGADIIDVGGESTRPGAEPVSPDEELRRVLPVVATLALAGAVVSIDTRHAAVMQATVRAGARIINDVSALAGDATSLEIAARSGADIVLMHMPGTPQTMRDHACYDDVVAEVAAYLAGRIAACLAAGIVRSRIAVDPGFGFGKFADDNERLLSALDRFRDLGCPVLVGLSRKFGKGKGPKERLADSIEKALEAVARGAAIVRVHDVAETVAALRAVQQ